MSFIVDKQTLDDLNVTDKYKSRSVFSLFNKVCTKGGEKLLDQMFSHPLTDADEINKRSAIFTFFQKRAFQFPIAHADFEKVENYLERDPGSGMILNSISTFKKMLMGSILHDVNYELMKDGLTSTINVLKKIASFYENLNAFDKDNRYTSQIQIVNTVITDSRLVWITEKDVANLTFFEISKYDYLFRYVLKSELEEVLKALYHLDVCIAVGNVAATLNFVFAKAWPAQDSFFYAENLSHPSLNNPIGNTFKLNGDNNMLFLTGANMAGKSTLMKTFGIAVYLAHMGFPVAANHMEFSVKEGIYSSINLTDDLSKGYSHFYAEVMRVKTAAEVVSSGKNIVIIFDELFKGTNVKDAYDATLSVTEAFANYTNCFFIISTHIIEVGETLKNNCPSIQFSYLPSLMNGNTPQYTYKLLDGISDDRHGMRIIYNEGILEMLK